jgi:hypothetical protein
MRALSSQTPQEAPPPSPMQYRLLPPHPIAPRAACAGVERADLTHA